MSTSYRIEIYAAKIDSPDRYHWVPFGGDKDSFAAARRHYDTISVRDKRILRLAMDKQGKTRIAVLLDNSAEGTQERESDREVRMIDPASRLVYEPDGDVLNARPRR